MPLYKKNPLVTVADYGAVGDGVTDDTAAIQAALTGETHIRGIVGDVYRCNSAVTIPSNRTIENLPSTSAPLVKGARAFVTNANATTFLSTVVGGGSNNVPVVFNNTNWAIG